MELYMYCIKHNYLKAPYFYILSYICIAWAYVKMALYCCVSLDLFTVLMDRRASATFLVLVWKCKEKRKMGEREMKGGKGFMA